MATLNIEDLIDTTPDIPMPTDPFAFPNGFNPGMELRDYFAAQFVAGTVLGQKDPATLAALAYEYADAMMNAR